jgi:hypothetical protein
MMMKTPNTIIVIEARRKSIVPHIIVTCVKEEMVNCEIKYAKRTAIAMLTSTKPLPKRVVVARNSLRRFNSLMNFITVHKALTKSF